MKKSVHSNVSGGFTMIEILTVLVLMGIVAAVAISRTATTSPYSVVSEAVILKNNLRFAQIKAMGDVPPSTWGINVGSGSHQLYNNRALANIKLPGDASHTHTLPAGLTATTGDITFDSWGCPVDASGNPLASNIDITITDGTQTQTITVTKNTGFIP